MANVNQISMINSLISDILEGNLNYKIDKTLLDDQHLELYNSICSLTDKQKQFVYEMQASTGTISSVAEDLSITIEDNNTFAQELYSNAQDLTGLNAENYRNTTDAVQKIIDMADNLQTIALSSGNVKSAESVADAAIKAAHDRVYGLIKLINDIDITSKKTLEYLKKFGSLTKEISRILKKVDNIAKQTEILSYNASIESKRAGTAGMGFGVIAQVVRDLSDESKREVSEIDDVLDSLNEGMTELSENIYDDYNNVTQSVEHTKTIESSLVEVEHSYSNVSSLIDEINSIIQAQNEAAASVSQEVGAVKDNSYEVTVGLEKLAESIAKQKSTVESLGGLSNYLNDASGRLVRLSGINESDTEYDGTLIKASADEAFKLLVERVLSYGRLYLLAPDEHKGILDELLTHNDIFESLWTNDAKGRFIYSNPPAGITNGRVREWFKESITGKRYISKVYISSITKKPCVTVSMPILDPPGNIVGVLGADLKLNIK